jgi:hypothetical protein
MLQLILENYPTREQVEAAEAGVGDLNLGSEAHSINSSSMLDEMQR